MEEKLRGIVLSSINYGENDKILNIFTLEKGTITAKIKGVKKAGAKLKFASEPFCFAEYIFSTLGNNRTVIGASLIDSFYSVREDIEKYFSGGSMLEFTRHFLKEGIENEEFFILLIESLKQLAYGNIEYKSVLAMFFIKALKLSGYGLNSDKCFSCGKTIEKRAFFDYISGSFYCEDCFENNGREINIATLNAIKKLSMGREVSSEEGVKALRLLEFYIVNRTEEKLNSLKELIKII